MAEYSFVTIWHIEAPIQDVWNMISDVEAWMQWWASVKAVTQLEPGDENGVGRKWRFTYKSVLPYSLIFEMTLTRSEPPYLSEGQSTGELEGTGRWHLSQEGTVTQVRFDWNVRTTKRWMEVLTPVLRPIFEWNHNVSMRHAGESLARQLKSRLLKMPSQAIAH